MGNKISSQKQNNNEFDTKSISQIMDYIATHYILTMDFISLRKLYEKEYCDKLVILTSQIVDRYFTNMEITYLAQRIKNGVEVNELNKDKLIFFDKDDLKKMDIQNSIKKRRVCIGIAKFYIKIAHIFSAIMMTINPVYIYKDLAGNTVKASLYEKGYIPSNASRSIYKLNICDNRIRALQPNDLSDNEINIHPKVCNMNINAKWETKTLTDEPGIPELITLYYDDNYDYKTGAFLGMSENTQRKYKEDLKAFYTVFTGNKEMPENIKRFSDIKLRDYHNTNECREDPQILRKSVSGKLSNKLFSEYAENVKQMIKKANRNQELLLNVLNKLFVYTIDPQTKEKQVLVNPSLTEEKVQEIVVETRSLIIQLYLTCEMDYTKGVQIYEAIVEQNILEIAQSQIRNLTKMTEEIQ